MASVALRRSAATLITARRLASTTAAHPSTASSSTPSIIPLSNVEAQWEHISRDEQIQVHRQLEALQKKDWKTLSIDEKKAAYYIAFGPHGPRTAVSPPGTGLKVALGTVGLIGVAAALFAAIRSQAPPPPKTISKEWEEASNKIAEERKLNPITGITSEGYKGKGFVH
jgi:cytochrome c oxidase subunit 4